MRFLIALVAMALIAFCSGEQYRYVIEVDTDAGFASPVVVDTTNYTPDSTYVNTLSLPEGHYFWRVKSLDQANNAGAWAMDSFAIDITPPSVVSLVSPANGSYLNQSNVLFVWHKAMDNMGVAYYMLQYAYDVAFSQGLQQVSITDTATAISLGDSLYYWQVRAVDEAGNQGGWSVAWDFNVITGVPPIPVLDYPVNDTIVPDTTIPFQWHIGFLVPENIGAEWYEGTIAGGFGYDRNVTSYDYLVDTQTELLTALANAEAGEVVYIDNNAEITLVVTSPINIPEYVTLASGRGNSSWGGALNF